MTELVPVQKQPSSAWLQEADACVSDYMKTKARVQKLLQDGRKEGLTDKLMGSIIKEKLLKAGFTDRTVRNYLPASAKNMIKAHKPKPKPKQKHAEKFSSYIKSEEKEVEPEPEIIYQMPAENYILEDLDKYDNAYLKKIVRWYHQNMLDNFNEAKKWDKKIHDYAVENKALKARIQELEGKGKPTTKKTKVPKHLEDKTKLLSQIMSGALNKKQG